MGLQPLDDLTFKRVKLNKILQEQKRRAGVTPLSHILEYPKQLQLTCDDHPSRWLFGGNRTGKTKWGAHECARFLHKRHPKIKFGPEPVEGWAACPSFDVQEDTTQKTLLTLLDKDRIVGEPQKLRGDIILKLKYLADDGTTSILNFKSYEQGRTKFQGAGKDFIWFDEEPPQDVYEEAVIRYQAGKKLYTFCTMTPVNGMTWVYDKVYLKTDDVNQKIICVEWNDNIFLSEDQKREMRGRFNEQALLVREKGLFVQRTGLVMPWFKRDVHMVDDILSIIPPGSDVYCGIDFGFAQPMAVAYVAVDYDDNHYVFDGIYGRGITTPQLFEIMKRKEASFPKGLTMRTRWADSAQASDIEELNKMGMPVGAVQKASGTSQENWDEYRARRFEEHGKVQPGTGHPKILYGSNLISVDSDGKPYNYALMEVGGLRWDEVRKDGVKTQRARWEDKCPKHFIDAHSYMMHMYKMPPESETDKQARQERHGMFEASEDAWAL